MRGLIFKGVGGFYSVRPEGAERGVSYLCRARGIFKKYGLTPTVGDLVDFDALDDEEGVVNDILPRRNLFVRPPIANVDIFVVMIAAANPAPNLSVVDKLLVSAEMAGTEAMICINKTDLLSQDKLRRVTDIYAELYPLAEICCAGGAGIENLSAMLAGKRSALAGPSGVGKSTLINCLLGGTELETGTVSGRTRRGRHTTRHVEIFDTDMGGMIFDTPGFTSFAVAGGDVSDLAFLFPEMREYLGDCRFDDCRHLKEPGCAVLEALALGRISVSRYASYVTMQREIEEKSAY